MVTFRNNNNNRRTNFRRNDRSFKSNGDRPKFGSNFSNNENFKRKAPGRNNHNAPKLIEKYNDLAREALASGDKILSENYFQHADHFTRIQKEQENAKIERVNSSSVTSVKSVEGEVKNESKLTKETNLEQDDKKNIKSIDKKTIEKSAAS